MGSLTFCVSTLMIDVKFKPFVLFLLRICVARYISVGVAHLAVESFGGKRPSPQ
jgi:hypothetical protein